MRRNGNSPISAKKRLSAATSAPPVPLHSGYITPSPWVYCGSRYAFRRA